MTAINHFTIDSVSGDISVFRSLAEEGLTRISQYTLRVIASDQGKVQHVRLYTNLREGGYYMRNFILL